MSSVSPKILHVITSLHTGGAERLMVDLLPKLRDLGLQIELAVLDGTRTDFFEALEKKGIPMHVLGMGAKAMRSPRCIPRLRRLMKQYDVVHTHNTPCQFFVALASVGLKQAPPLITTEHNTTNRRRNHRWLRPLDRWMYGRYAHIICVSEAVKEELQHYLPQLPSTSTIMNGIDVANFQHTAPAADLQQAFSLQKRLVMAAAFRAQKDHETAILALHHLPEVYHLFLAGDGERRATVEDFVCQQQLSHRVHFLGNRADIPAVLKAADIVIMSSKYEGLSLSSLEGLACGRPVVASNVRGLREIVGGAGLLFPQGDAITLAKLILQLDEDNHLRQTTIEKGLQRALHFDIQSTVQAHYLTYLKDFNA